MKILIIAAMPTESEDIVKKFGMRLVKKLAHFYPLYNGDLNGKEIYLIQTYVGSINAPTATGLAIQEIKPDFALKIGCIGGNSPGLKKNDIIIPRSFFHTGAWITRSYTDGNPTSDSSTWQALFGNEPYQNSKDNLGGLEFIFSPDQILNNHYKQILNDMKLLYREAHLGSADMVIFDHRFMDHIRNEVIKIPKEEIWCSDNESYAVAQICKIFNIPFTGIYFIASSDYEDIGGYDPDAIRAQTKETILPVVEKLIQSL